MLHDLRLALRMLLKHPGFALVVIVTLALGIGANTAIFSVVDGVLLRRAPVKDLDRLVMVWETDRHSSTTREPASVPDYLDFRARSRSLATLVALMGDEVNLAPPGAEPVRLAALRVTHEFLPMLGIAPLVGRSFTEEEDRAQGPRVALISESLWTRSFGRDPDIVESAVLTLMAAAVGVGLAFAGLRALLAIAPADVPRLASVTIDLRVLGATLGVSVLIGLAFGMIPTLQARRVDLQTALKTEGAWPASSRRERSRLRAPLVVAELALAVVLVVGAGLLIKSFWRLLQVDPGFRAAGVLKAEYQLPAARYPVDFRVWPNFKEMHAFTDALVGRAAALPGVESVAIAGNHPLDPGFTNSFSVVGREAEARTWPEISVRRVTPGYFRTVGLSLVRGRLLSDADRTTAAAVLLVNEAAARRFFPDRDPIGARIAFWGAARTIVGVVANEKFHGLSEAPPLAVYLPLAQAPSATGAGVLLVRTSGDPAAFASAARAAIREIDPALAVFGVEPLDRTLAQSLSQRRFTMLLVGLFASVALALAVVGVHGVLSYGVTERTREIGIRMALGAHPARVLGLVVGQGLVLVLAGLAIGLAGAFALTRLLASLLFGVTPTDPATFAAVAGVLALVALAASYLPARRASRVDPLLALRHE